jgi:glycerol-3-phosphate dehydrogenase
MPRLDPARTTLSPARRAADLERMREQRFDLLVVGGGVTGCGVALDAAARGLRVALVERDDLASGTSSRSGKLIHGGLRYMEQLRFGLVRESLRERALLLRTIAPHLVRPLEFLYLLHGRVWERPYIGAGMILYDTLGGAGAVPRHRHLSRRRALAEAPAVAPGALTGAIAFHDAQVDDARHTLAVARTAAGLGAAIATRAEVTAFVREAGGRVAGAAVRDGLTGDVLEVAARHVVVAGGPWSGVLQGLLDAGAPALAVRPSKGVHLVVPRAAIDARAAFVLRAERDPMIFVRPWNDGRFWMLGTTDTPWQGPMDDPRATREDVDYLLRNVNAVLREPLRRADVVGAFAGLRPLVDDGAADTSDASREHRIASPAPGLTTVAGGKYTTYRAMAQETVDAVAAALEDGGGIGASPTARLPLLGAAGHASPRDRADAPPAGSGLTAEQVAHLLGRHGDRTPDVLALIARRPELAAPLGDTYYLEAEVVHAVEAEGALGLEDVLARRTHVAIEAGDGGAAVADRAAELIAPVLGWDAPFAREAAARFKRDAVERQAPLRDATPATPATAAGA